MAIFHLTASVVSRARGHSAVAVAAYRSGTNLRDRRYATTHHYAARRAVAHAEILAPRDAPEWVHDRELLWNRVEERERRKDSQLARIIDLGLPVELSPNESLTLLRDYVVSVFVSKGMIADIGIRRDNPENPHAYALLTLRDVNATGFGPKARRWNGKVNLLEWRAAWAERANEHLARAGHSARIDHRTLEAQQIELTPGRRMGVGRPAADNTSLPAHLAQRIMEQRQIAAGNGAAMLADPTLALRSLVQQRVVFTAADLRRFLRSRTADEAQLEAVHAAVMQCVELVALQPGSADEPRFTARHLIEAAGSLRQRLLGMAARRGHGMSTLSRATLWASGGFRDEHRQAFDYVMQDGDAKVLIVDQTFDKEGLLAALQRACESNGMQWLRVALSNLPACLECWQRGADLPTRSTVLVVDAAEMMSVRVLERLLSVADKGRCRVLLLADAIRVDALQVRSPLWDVVPSLRVV